MRPELVADRIQKGGVQDHETRAQDSSAAGVYQRKWVSNITCGVVVIPGDSRCHNMERERLGYQADTHLGMMRGTKPA